MSTVNLLESYAEIIYPNIPDHPQNQYTNVLLIHKSVPEYQTFVDSVNANTFPIAFSSSSSSAELLGILRRYFTSIPRIGFCFVSTLDIPPLFIDNEPMFINNETMPYSNNVQLVVSMVQEFSVVNMDFLACDTLNYSTWRNYYDILRQSTGITVGASDNKTGNIKYGGDWILESTSQDIETVYFTQSIEYYSYLLDAVPFASNVIPRICGITTDGTYLYVGQNLRYAGYNTAIARTINRVEIANPTNIFRDFVVYSTVGVTRQISSPYNGFIYAACEYTLVKINTSTRAFNNVSISGQSNFYGVFLHNGKLYVTTPDKICRLSPDTDTLDTTWGTNGIFSTGRSTLNTCAVGNDGYLYAGLNDSMMRINITNTTDVNYDFKFNGVTLPQNMFGQITYHNGYLYSTSNDNRISRVNLSNYSQISLSWKTIPTPYIYNGTPRTTALNGVVGYEYVIYAGINIDTGSSNNDSQIALYDLPIPPSTPLNTVSFDIGNTVSRSLGNLQVSIIDPSNVSTNGISYWYSTNGNTYINSNIANNGPTQSRYTFNITGLSSSVNTVYVYAKNSVGNSAPISTPVNITGAPGSITSYSTDFSLENGITVSILDTNNRASNNIYYYYYTFRTGDTSPNQSGNIAVYSNSYVSLTSGSSVSSFNIPNLLKGDYSVYVAAVNPYGSSIYTPAVTPISVICFKEDSRILTNRGYRKIQNLKKGDLVKTLKHGFKPIYNPELFEDLVLTGCHSILLDGYVNEEQLAKSIKVNGRIYLTEGKYRVPVCADLRSSIYEKAGKYMVYHIALEHDDYYMNYGIYANGLLVESTSKRFLEEMNIMDI